MAKHKLKPLNHAEAKAAGIATKPTDLAHLALQEVATVQLAPDWPNQPTVQSAANVQLTDATGLKATSDKLVAARAVVTALEALQAQMVVSVKQDRRTLQAVITVVSKGDPKAIVAWGSVVASRNVVVETNAAPLGVSILSGALGQVEVRCNVDRHVKAYVFQLGTDPANPQGWPAPVVWSGSKYTFTGLTSGQKMYGRVAVVRPKTGESLWSDVVQVSVR